ncbi:hypothetical protein PANO111632_02645 [Paracoccus nototheniae]|uniref:Uncharacterized protein n=1 Tax=Paracoccus nototheniae TaxID=2489002 RepID=A0ABW4DV63_9RHOB|nr:hypothetical protein [Paracoccus nototheniae]
MKIRMLTGLSGPLFNLVAGDLHETDEAEAGRLIAAGFAEPADETATRAPAVETGTRPAPAEAAVKKPAGTTRKRG